MPPKRGPVVTVIRQTTTRNSYGHSTTTETRLEVRSYGVAPRASSEQQTVGRGAVIEGLTAYLPPGTVLDPDDRLEIAGYVNSAGNPRLYEVDGEPGIWTNPYSGRAKGVEVALKRATG